MKISQIVLSGVDDAVEPKALRELAQVYPFLAFGVLFDLRSEGQPRCPSPFSRKGFEQEANDFSFPLVAQLSGQYLENVLCGNSQLLNHLPACYKAVQLNFGTYNGGFVDWPSVENLAHKHKRFQFFVQYREDENEVPLTFRKLKNVALLFDRSNGRGRLPTVWTDPVESISAGYAGGLAPENVQEQLIFLQEIVKNREVWIDSCSGLRDSKNRFDMDRVRAFIRPCQRYISN